MHFLQILNRVLSSKYFLMKVTNHLQRLFKTKKYLENKRLELERINFYSQFISSGDICFDVGANIGNRIHPLLALGAKVIAFEPQLKCRNILKSRFGDKIVIVPFGLSSKEEIKEFYISEISTISSFSKDWIDAVKQNRFEKFEWNHSELVQMTTLDKAIEKYGLPEFIKIDVEGFELEVINGLSSKVRIISFEYTTPEQTDKALRCFERIFELNQEIEGNYSVGESMKFASINWLSPDELRNLILSNEFINTRFGDIYIRSKSSSS
jgi:FkbM family methyltransferase